MRVEIDGGAVIQLGKVEATPTIGVTDFSRRVTDDFGVTTVVKRGFSRRMSVRLAVPFDDVDALQRDLAALRAKAALWVANDTIGGLSIRGFYKDFSVDLAVPPTSYCTLTIEGVVENDSTADNGADPAPDGKVSTLRLLQPVDVTDASLTGSSVTEDDYAPWNPATTYAAGARIISTSTHRIYESATGGNAGNDPLAGGSQWINVGPTNRWAMFDQALGTSTTGAGLISVTINAGGVNALALIDVTAASVRVQGAGYDQSEPVTAGAITFGSLPAGPVTVTIAGGGQVSIGTLLIGRMTTLGITESSPTAGITDFSRKDVDQFGGVSIVERAWSKRMAARALIRTDAIEAVTSRITAVRATPSLWIGSGGVDALTLYGFFKDFSIEVGPSISKVSLSVEGLSRAAPIAVQPDDGDVAALQAQVTAILSDGIITHGREKRDLVDRWHRLEAQYLALNARWIELGRPSDTAGEQDRAETAYEALYAFLASLSPAWDDLTTDTPVDAGVAAQRWGTTYTAVEAFGAAISGRQGASAYSAQLSNEVHQLPADVNGNVLSYDGAATSIKVLYGATDVTGSFTSAVAPGGNPQGLAITGTYPHLALTGGFDGNEDVATFTFRLTGTGAHEGLILDKVWSFSKSKAAADGVSPPLIRLTSDRDVASYDKNDTYVGGPITFTAIRQNIPGNGTYFRLYRVSDNGLLAADTSEGYGSSNPDYFGGSGGDRFVLTALGVRDYIHAHGAIRIEAYRDGYAATDSVSIAKVRDGATGAGAFTLIADTAQTAIPTPTSLQGSPPYIGWGLGHAHSVESYVGGAVASWTVPADSGGGANIMAGLTQGTGSDRGNSYDSITFALHRNDQGQTGVYVNGNAYGLAGPTVSTAAATRMRVQYDGRRYVRFWVNDTELTAYEWGQQSDPLRFAAALASVNPRLQEIAFSASGKAGADGVPAVNGWLTNESHTLPADSAGNIQNYVGAQGVFRVNNGGVDVTGTPTSYATLDNPQGLTRSGGPALIDANGFFRVDAGFDPGETSATVTLRAVYGGTTIDRTFSLARSKDGTPGQNGLNAKIMFLASSHQTIGVNGDGSLVPQTTTFTANRTNPGGSVTAWRMLDDDGVGRTGWMFSGDFARYLGGATAGEQIDVVSFSADILNGHIAGSGRNTNGLIFEAAMHDNYAIVDRISIARVRSGRNGNDGENGTDGADGFGVIASPSAFVIPSFANGTSKPAWTGGSCRIYLNKGGVEIAADSYSYNDVQNISTIAISGNTVTFADIVGEKGEFTVQAAKAGVTYKTRVTVVRAKDGSAAFTSSTNFSATVNTGIAQANTTVPGGRSVRLSGSADYVSPAGRNGQGVIGFYWRNLTDGGTEQYLGQTAGSYASNYNVGSPTDPEYETIYGSVSGSFTFTSPSPDKLIEYTMRFGTSAGGATSNITGTLRLEVIS